MSDGIPWSQVGGWLWQQRDSIAEAVKKVLAWFRKPDGSDRGILILGAGGVGKTTLARILSGKYDWLLDEPWKYGESFGIERFKLKDDEKVQVVVPPGQTARRETTWTELLANVAGGKYRGVILVSANGCHSIATSSYKDHPLYKGNKDDFVTALVKRNRDDEAAILQRLTPHLTVSNGKVWLLTVVAKEDLWFPERTAAEQRLVDELAPRLQAAQAAKGATNFRHEAVAVSLLISNFVTNDGETLKKNTAGYDHRQSVESIRRLFEVLNALQDWEDTK
jgi:hypothetical protein